MKKPTIYIGADHAGFEMKTSIYEHLIARGFDVEDLGAHTLDPHDDYPEYAAKVAEAVRNHSGSIGVLSCGNAEGICIAANKFDDIRAGIGYSIEASKTMRTDDHANIICIPGRITTKDDPLKIIDAFLETNFSQAPRHVNRLQQIHEIEERQTRHIHIVPSVLVETEEEFVQKMAYKPLREIASLWQIDILDGSLFNKTSWADPKIVATCSSLPALELHLMIENPLPIISEWKQHVPTLARIIVHAEIQQNILPILKAIKSMDLEAGIAINPETSLNEIKPFIDLINVLLIMSVHPGASGQTFLGSEITKKIHHAKQLYPHLLISVDGGIQVENAHLIAQSGADQLCIASALWNATNPELAFQKIQNVISSN